MNYRTWAFLLLALPALACSFTNFPLFATQVQDTISVAAATLSEGSPAPLNSDQITPAQSYTPFPVNPVCVQPGVNNSLPVSTYEEYPNVFLEYLNAGGATDVLQLHLENLEIVNATPSVVAADLTGDGKRDVVVSFLEPNPQTVPAPGALIVYICLGEQYILTHIELSGDFLSGPRILHVQDLNADGTSEVIYSSTTCGSNTCFEATQILLWNGAEFEHALSGNTDDLPFPDLQITDYDQDEIYTLEMTSGGYSSFGAGPQRTLTRIWDYNQVNLNWEQTQQILGPSSFRIHMLHDADNSVRAGEYEVALVLYDQVINNLELLDWGEPEIEKLNLGAYARYKIVVVYALQGNLDRAQSFFNEITTIYPANIPQRAYIDMAAEFLSAFTKGGQDAGCAIAQQFAAINAGRILVPLGSQTYGYANQDYSPLDICP